MKRGSFRKGAHLTRLAILAPQVYGQGQPYVDIIVLLLIDKIWLHKMLCAPMHGNDHHMILQIPHSKEATP